MNRTLSQFADVAQGVIDSRRSVTGSGLGGKRQLPRQDHRIQGGGQPTLTRAVDRHWRQKNSPKSGDRSARLKLTRSTPERFRVQVRSPPCRLRAGRRRLGPSGTGDTSAAAARHSAVPKPSPRPDQPRPLGQPGRPAMTTHHPIAPAWACGGCAGERPCQTPAGHLHHRFLGWTR